METILDGEVTLRKTGAQIYHLKLNRPIVTPPVARQLDAVSDWLVHSTRPEDHLYIEGYSDEIFCLGGDVGYMLKCIDDGPVRSSELRWYAKICARAITQGARIPAEITTVVKGRALGGGAELAMVGDNMDLGPYAMLYFPEYAQGHFPFAGGEPLARLWDMDELVSGERYRGPAALIREGRHDHPIKTDEIRWLSEVRQAAGGHKRFAMELAARAQRRAR